MAFSTRLMALVFRRWFARFRIRAYMSSLYRWRFSGAAAERLLLAPQDIRTSEPTTANDIYAGRFSFAGNMISCNGQSPFLVDNVSLGWQHELLGFSWLRHLRAAGHEVSKSQSRALIEEWLEIHGKWQRPISWQPEIVARRIISWISHSPHILDGADRDFYRKFMRSLSRQVHYLRKAANHAEAGLFSLTSTIALNYACLCMSGMDRIQKHATRKLEHELNQQILADGGHISRNPAVIIELLLDLLPLKQTFTAREIAPPEALQNAIDRMMPAVRFFRHSDGSMALFNGVSTTPADALATVLAYDDTWGTPPNNAPHSGYQRINYGNTTVIVDTGAPPPIQVSNSAHAGCLSFEMSSKNSRIIVNCGKTLSDYSDWTRAARTTAAHSTASLSNIASAQFLLESNFSKYVGEPIIRGPRDVTVKRDEDAAGTSLNLSHDGYKSNLGTIHQRDISVDADGSIIRGADRFISDHKKANLDFAIRFHLHPNVKASLGENGEKIYLSPPNGEIWCLSADIEKMTVEESIFLPLAKGPRPTLQIVLEGTVAKSPSVSWTIERIQEKQPIASYSTAEDTT